MYRQYAQNISGRTQGGTEIATKLQILPKTRKSLNKANFTKYFHRKQSSYLKKYSEIKKSESTFFYYFFILYNFVIEHLASKSILTNFIFFFFFFAFEIFF